jgi:hypothetical protein
MESKRPSRFTARSGHSNVPQENHLTAEWRGKVRSGQRLSFLTVFVPMPEGTTEPAHDLNLDVGANEATVKRGSFRYTFPALK